MLKSIIVYRIAPELVMPQASALELVMDGGRFVECGPTQQESTGWVEPRGVQHAALIENIGGQRILKLCVQTKAVPGSAVKDELDKRAKKHLEATGFKLGSKAKKDLKDEIIHEMLPRAFAKTSASMIWIDAENHLLVVGSGSIKKADRITSALVDTVVQAGGAMSLTLLNTKMSPATGMSHWLKTQEAPYEFSVDRECELKSVEGEKATVRYSRHNLEIKEVVEHIEQGKLPTKLAMTWNGRVSFVLADDLSLKKIEVLDVATEGKKGAKGDEMFDADVAIVTGELQKLIPALIEALDGEIESDRGAITETPAAGAAGAAAPQASPAAEAVGNADSDQHAASHEPALAD